MKARRVAPISTSWQGWHADPSSPGSPAIWCRMVTARQPWLPLSQHITHPQQPPPPPPLPPHLHHCGWMSDRGAKQPETWVLWVELKTKTFRDRGRGKLKWTISVTKNVADMFGRASVRLSCHNVLLAIIIYYQYYYYLAFNHNNI